MRKKKFSMVVEIRLISSVIHRNLNIIKTEAMTSKIFLFVKREQSAPCSIKSISFDRFFVLVSSGIELHSLKKRKKEKNDSKFESLST